MTVIPGNVVTIKKVSDKKQKISVKKIGQKQAISDSAKTLLYTVGGVLVIGGAALGLSGGGEGSSDSGGGGGASPSSP